MASPKTLFGGKTDEQKDLEKAAKAQEAEALQQKLVAIQDDVGTQTRELIKRFGGGTRSPLVR